MGRRLKRLLLFSVAATCVLASLLLSNTGATAQTLTGTIAFADGGVLPDYVRVRVYLAESGSLVSSANTDAAANWRFNISLASGAYKIQFWTYGGQYPSEWWQDSATRDGATHVIVEAGNTAVVDPMLDLGGSIAGTIGFAEGGTLPSSVEITVYDAESGAWIDSGSTGAGQGWSYRVGGLTPGEFKMEFIPFGGHHVREWWHDASSRDLATPVSVIAGNTTLANPALDLGGVISGTIGFAEGGASPTRVQVTIYRADTGAYAASRSVDASQLWQFTVDNLPAGNYVAQFNPSNGDYLSEWWLDSSTREGATSVIVEPGSTKIIEPTLDLEGVISGTISFAEGGVKPSNVNVRVYRADTGAYVASDSANASQLWQFAVGNLPAGSYVVQINSWDGDYWSEWWQDSATREGATPVIVEPGSTGVISPMLDPGGSIDGTIAFAPGGALPSSVDIILYDAESGSWIDSEQTNVGQGWRFRFGRLTSGGFKVRFTPAGGSYLQEWWQDAYSQDTATLLTVVQGASTSVSPMLDPGGFIAGTPTFHGFGTASKVAISVYRSDTGELIHATQAKAPDWGYITAPLHPGDYLLNFDGSCMPEWWQDRDSKEDAVPVQVVSGFTTTVNPDLSLGNRVSGIVDLAPGAAAPDRIEIALAKSDSGSLAGLTTTTAAKEWQYSLSGLPDGSYSMHFKPSGGGYASEWWEDRSAITAAASLNVADGTEALANPTLDLRRGILLWARHARDLLYSWSMDGASRTRGEYLSPNRAPAGWEFAGVGDFDGDRETDILWRNEHSGSLLIWFMDGPKRIRGAHIPYPAMSEDWVVTGTGDFDSDGRADILWRNHRNGKLRTWFMSGAKKLRGTALSPASMPTAWTVAGTGDFDSDGKADILWWNSNSGLLRLWFMDGARRLRGVATTPASMAGTWRIAAVGDLNNDQKADVLWKNDGNASLFVWFMDGERRKSTARTVPDSMPIGWDVLGYGTNSTRPPQRPSGCEYCHNGDGDGDGIWDNVGYDPDGAGPAPAAPNVMGDGANIFGVGGRPKPYNDGTWGFNVNGHGANGTAPNTPSDADGPLLSGDAKCTQCHDISIPAGTHLDGVLNSVELSQNQNANTAHLNASFIGLASPEWDVQLTLDNRCFQSTGCHTAGMGHGRHSKDADPAAGAVQFGQKGTVPNGESIPYPVDSDISTNAAITPPDFAPCISCHNPHGTHTNDSSATGSFPFNEMLRDERTETLCKTCHK